MLGNTTPSAREARVASMHAAATNPDAARAAARPAIAMDLFGGVLLIEPRETRNVLRVVESHHLHWPLLDV